ncbi:MAG: DUF2063 domain-containing protein [Opitutus sp.]|nr:DUF2063 domain-containing protein [Opitutus sp.]
MSAPTKVRTAPVGRVSPPGEANAILSPTRGAAFPRPRSVRPLSVRSRAELRALQRATLAITMNPLTRAHRTARTLSDGTPARAAAARVAKANDRLTALERLEIYNRMYWFRVLDSLHEDCPGLRAALGERRFLRLAEAFLEKYPSEYWTLRDLPQRLARFIREEPRWTAPHTALCEDIARFEWAQVEVYDGAARPVFTVDDLLGADPAKLRLALQPYLQLLDLRYPVDDYLIAIRKREALLRGDASNAPTVLRRHRDSKVPRPRRAPCWIAVHRHDGKIYFKRLDPAAFQVLAALRAGRTLERALAAGIPRARKPREDWAAPVQGWFRSWMELGWFCRR